MKLVITLPFRSKLSNFLSFVGLKRILELFLVASFIIFNSGCSKLNKVENIAVEIWQNGSPLECNAFASEQQIWSIQQLAFFISDVQLSGESTSHPVQLSTTPWQTDDVVLIQPNLVDCATTTSVDNIIVPSDNSTPEALKTINHIQFSIPVDLDSAQQLAFNLAVPFALNHQNPLLQPSPLNLPSMFWSWRSGHKFFRLDMQSPDKSWVFHLGSVGCSSVSTMRSPEAECIQPNIVSFILDKKHDGTKLVMHIDRLIDNTSLQNSDSCLFHTDQHSCSILMSNLKTQSVFEWH